ncbi:hypothetical protein GCM10010401_13840 [Rarobacter faecitabidus]|uniref:Uncharacterized protein n=1 Tax=Rarobacter faecitabidus TaxID=13243 RepID=A0A542ZE18_RARFA|nr:hypothetical protein [Rarobacter faecitabidus]TQL58568.1 hypothetical protein FB461_1983 [Rarobacter faecitabidus]
MHLKKTLIAAVIAALAFTGLTAVPAQAATTGYGKTATTVAKSIKCKNLRIKRGSSAMTKSSLVCDLKGKRVNVITFKSEAQQIKWLDYVPAAFPYGGYVAVARGVVIVSKNGTKSAASAGAKALNGAVVPV